MAKIIIGLDLGKTFGYSLWEDKHLSDSGELKMEYNHKPYELLEWIKFAKSKFTNGSFKDNNFEIVMETGQGFMSKNAWRGFGVQEWAVENFCKENNIPLHTYHISWLKVNYRRLEKSNINDAIELVEYHFKKIEELCLT